jgi:hypothetical protein
MMEMPQMIKKPRQNRQKFNKKFVRNAVAKNEQKTDFFID